MMTRSSFGQAAGKNKTQVPAIVISMAGTYVSDTIKAGFACFGRSSERTIFMKFRRKGRGDLYHPLAEGGKKSACQKGQKRRLCSFGNRKQRQKVLLERLAEMQDLQCHSRNGEDEVAGKRQKAPP